MPRKTTNKPAKPAKKPAAKRAAAKPVLLSGGNPQIAKGYGEVPVKAYIAAMPGWKRGLGRRLDALITRTVPGVRKAVKWNTPFYGMEENVWFLGFHCITKYVKVAFFRGLRRCGLSRPSRPSRRTCATSTSTRTTSSTKLSSPLG